MCLTPARSRSFRRTASRRRRLPTPGRYGGLAFVRDGSLLVIAGSDGDVRLWDVERNESGGLIWNGTGANYASPPWYDGATESL